MTSLRPVLIALATHGVVMVWFKRALVEAMRMERSSAYGRLP